MRLIDADALVSKIRTYLPRTPFIALLVGVINNEPTITFESLRPQGEWVVCGDGDNVPWMCTHCGKTTAHKYKVMYGKYCPNCGARMQNPVR